MHTDFDAMNSATSERAQGEDVRNEAERGNGERDANQNDYSITTYP